jgi:hypothetical protein
MVVFKLSRQRGAWPKPLFWRLAGEWQLRHTGFGKRVWQCSKAMLIVACASVLVNGGGATDGGHPQVAQFGGLPVRGNKGQTESRMAGE